MLRFINMPTSPAAPLSPPTTPPERDRSNDALLQLSLLPGIGPRTLRVLLDAFGNPAAALKADPMQIKSLPGVGDKIVHAIAHANDHVCVDSLYQWCRDHRVRAMFSHQEHYPASLHDLEDPPPVLFYRGQIRPIDSLAVGIVGTRHATPYGINQAAKIADALARRGVTIVSGLARGIDSISHQAALDAGGRTIGVLAGGLGQIYPPENIPLVDAIAADGGDHGAVISEMPPWSKPKPGNFPQRNRLIAALSRVTLVIEAPQRSGSLITAPGWRTGTRRAGAARSGQQPCVAGLPRSDPRRRDVDSACRRCV